MKLKPNTPFYADGTQAFYATGMKQSKLLEEGWYIIAKYGTLFGPYKTELGAVEVGMNAKEG